MIRRRRAETTGRTFARVNGKVLNGMRERESCPLPHWDGSPSPHASNNGGEVDAQWSENWFTDTIEAVFGIIESITDSHETRRLPERNWVTGLHGAHSLQRIFLEKRISLCSFGRR